MNTNPSGVPAISTSGYQPLTPEQIDAMSIEEIDAEIDRLRAKLSAGPTVFDFAVERACAKQAIAEPGVIDIELAVVAALREAAADPTLSRAIVTNFTAAGRTSDADDFMRAVAEVSAR